MMAVIASPITEADGVGNGVVHRTIEAHILLLTSVCVTFRQSSWTMIEKLRSLILALPVSTSIWTESLPTKSLLGV